MPNLLSSFLMKIKKVIGKFKDEAAGKPIIEFVGLKSKIYSYNSDKKQQDSKRRQKEYYQKRYRSLRLFGLSPK